MNHDTRNHEAFKDAIRLNEAPDERFVAFPLKNTDGQITGLAMKSPTKQRFLGKREGVWVSAPTHPGRPVDRVVLTEDPVDAMSHYQLCSKQDTNTVYVSPAGNPSARQLEVIKGHVAMINAKSIVLATDNDSAGHKFDQLYQKNLRDTQLPITLEKPSFKDWNADVFARQLYQSRLMDRSNLHPDKVAQTDKLKAPSSVEEITQRGEKKGYVKLAGDPSLNRYYVERTIDGKSVEFSLSEVAYVNKDRKLAKTLGVDIDKGYVAQQRSTSANLSVSVQQDTKKLQQQSSGRRFAGQPVDQDRDAQIAVTQTKIKQGRKAIEQSDQHIRTSANATPEHRTLSVNTAEAKPSGGPATRWPATRWPAIR